MPWNRAKVAAVAMVLAALRRHVQGMRRSSAPGLGSKATPTFSAASFLRFPASISAPTPITIAASVGATIFDGRIGVSVDQDYTATLPALNIVTPWKIFGGTWAMAVVPSMIAMNVDVGLEIPAFTGPRGNRFGPFHVKPRRHQSRARGHRLLSLRARLGCRQVPLERRRVRLRPDRQLQHEAARQYEPQPLGRDDAARRDLFRSADRLAGDWRRHLLGQLGEPGYQLRDGQHSQSRRLDHQELRSARRWASSATP